MNSQVKDYKRIIFLATLSVLLVCCVVGILVLTVPKNAFAQTKGKFTFTDNSLTSGTINVSIADSPREDGHGFGESFSGYAATSVKIMTGGSTVYTANSTWNVSYGSAGANEVLSEAQQSFVIDVVDLLEQGKLTAGVTYTVRCSATLYDNQGMGLTGSDGAMLVETDIIDEDFTFTLQTVSELPDDPVKTGYTFTGWYTDENCTHKYTEDKIVGNITLYAGWRPNTYTVVFDKNGGTGSMSNLAMTYDVAKALTSNSFSRAGYKFKGWATSASGSVKYTDGQSVKNLTATDNSTVRLYAVWELVAYTVKYNANGGTGSMSNQQHIVGQSLALTANTFSRTGYTFKGWATSAGGGVVYTDGQSVQNIGNAGSTVNLYAVWQINVLTVKYHANDGTGSIADQKVNYNQTVSLTSIGDNIVREYYTFKGWATSAGGDVVYVDGAEITNDITTGADGVLNLYAVWERNKCVVTFIVDGEVYAYLEVDAGTPTEDVFGATGVSTVLYKLDGNYPN